MSFLSKIFKPDYEKVAKELDPNKSYILVVPKDVDPAKLVDTGWFEDLNVFIVQADKMKIMELG